MSEMWHRHGKLMKWADEIAALEAENKRLAFLWDENAKVAKASANVAKENKRLEVEIRLAEIKIVQEKYGEARNILRAALEEGGDDG